MQHVNICDTFFLADKKGREKLPCVQRRDGKLSLGIKEGSQDLKFTT
jgi:hypothetical protein